MGGAGQGSRQGGEGIRANCPSLWLPWEGVRKPWEATTGLYSWDDRGGFCSSGDNPGCLVHGSGVSRQVIN